MKAGSSGRDMAVPVPIERLWTVKDVATYLGVSKSWVYQHAEAGDLPCLRVGALLRFDPDAIRTWARHRATAGTSTTKRGS